ncbi:EF-P 5-aminopentanol modification-associated protein YfmH [Pseudogracilibacillus sp. ICA-222130]|uniref:EF-P 5-aminopentanol modification-associated protein YfmH n=1 Tax=Pseudogracilibacillus sp. ICA-222130 TaxID=3134655 RepID=UPI0030BA670A
MHKHVYEAIDETLYETTLPNGLKVMLIPKTESEKTFGIFMTNYGSIDRTFTPLGKNEMTTVPDGIAHFLEHKLFEKEDRDVFTDFLSEGASPNAYTSFTKTAYLFSATSNIERNVEILLDFVQSPYFSEESVEKEKGIIEQEIKMYDDQVDFKLYMQTLQNMYETHPVRIDIAGTVESIQHITKNDLYTCYETFYHPSNMVLCIVGNFQVEHLMDTIQKNQATKTFATPTPIKRAEITEKETVYKAEQVMSMDVSMPKVMIGMKHNPDFVNETERMKHELMEQWVLDYFFSSSGDFYEILYKDELIDESFDYQSTVEEAFNFTLFSSNTENPTLFHKRLTSLLYQIKSYPFTEENLDKMKRKWMGEYIIEMDSLEYIANEYCHYYFEGIDFFTMQQIAHNITLADLRSFIENWVQEDKLTVTMIEKES